MSLIRKILFLTALICLPLSAIAQETMVLTLEQSVGLALEQNPELLIADKELAKSKAGILEAYSALMPTLDASANLSHAWSIQEIHRLINQRQLRIGKFSSVGPNTQTR